MSREPVPQVTELPELKPLAEAPVVSKDQGPVPVRTSAVPQVSFGGAGKLETWRSKMPVIPASQVSTWIR